MLREPDSLLRSLNNIGEELNHIRDKMNWFEISIKLLIAA